MIKHVLDKELFFYRRLCVFCGNEPEDENKEHILPKWLISLTGSSKRTVKVGFNWFTGNEMNFSYNSLKFPSCKSCNERYSDLEDIAKRVLTKVLTEDSITAYECIYLLDWFDKLRVGLWLGFRYINKNAFSVEPGFHIDQRIRQKDRLLAIRKLPPVSKGLNCIGSQTALFNFHPSCFSLRVNDLIFTNASSDFLVSSQVGFPYCVKSFVKEDRSGFDVILEDGKKKVRSPIFRHRLNNPDYLIIQPIYCQSLQTRPDLYDNDYVRRYSYGPGSGHGCIFIEERKGWYTLQLDQALELEFPKIPVDTSESELKIEVLKLQNFIQDNSRVSGERLKPEVRKIVQQTIRKAYSFNSSIIRSLQNKQ